MDGSMAKANDLELGVGVSTIKIRADKSSSSLHESIPTPIRLTGTGWHHIAWVITKDFGAVYLDGELLFRSDVGGSNRDFHAESPRIGGWWDANPGSEAIQKHLYKGFIDELRVWSVARTQDEIRKGMNSGVQPKSADLVAYWNFDAGSFIDLSGHGFKGELSGNSTIKPIALSQP